MRCNCTHRDPIILRQPIMYTPEPPLLCYELLCLSEESRLAMVCVLHTNKADEQRQQALEKRKAELQQRRQEANAEKQKECLDYALMTIRDHGGSISRKQLTAILMKKFELEHNTVSKFITAQIAEGTLYEADKNITASPETALAF